MSCGIYKIYFKDDSFYIGCSINIEKRIKDHISKLVSGKHKNTKLQEKYSKFGIVEYVILEECNSDVIYIKEFEWIKNTNATSSLNISIGGRGCLKGELHPSSKTTNEQALLVVEYIVNSTNTHKDIAELVGVTVDTVNNISKGSTHSWIKEEHSELYDKMLSLKNKRSGMHITAKSMGLILPKVISPEGDIYSITNIRQFSREHSLDSGGLNKLLHGKQKTTKGWRVYEGN